MLFQILETVLGFSSSNLHGVDLSPSAVERNRKAHPEYKLKYGKSNIMYHFERCRNLFVNEVAFLIAGDMPNEKGGLATCVGQKLS